MQSLPFQIVVEWVRKARMTLNLVEIKKQCGVFCTSAQRGLRLEINKKGLTDPCYEFFIWNSV
jgi:hypothetical protein